MIYKDLATSLISNSALQQALCVTNPRFLGVLRAGQGESASPGYLIETRRKRGAYQDFICGVIIGAIVSAGSRIKVQDRIRLLRSTFDSQFRKILVRSMLHLERDIYLDIPINGELKLAVLGPLPNSIVAREYSELLGEDNVETIVETAIVVPDIDVGPSIKFEIRSEDSDENWGALRLNLSQLARGLAQRLDELSQDTRWRERHIMSRDNPEYVEWLIDVNIDDPVYSETKQHAYRLGRLMRSKGILLSAPKLDGAALYKTGRALKKELKQIMSVSDSGPHGKEITQIKVAVSRLFAEELRLIQKDR